MNSISASQAQAMIPAKASRILCDENVRLNQLDDFSGCQKSMKEVLGRLIWGNFTDVKAFPNR